MSEYKKKAFDGATDLVKQLITLATGTLALTATFIKDLLHIESGQPVPHKWLLYTTWVLMLVSVLCGLLAHGAIIGTLDSTEDDGKGASAFNFNIALWAKLQSLIFYLGIVAMIVFVACNLS